MITYSADGKTAVYDGYRFRKDPNTGYYLCTRKTDAGRRERLHVYVWRKSNGEIPEGYHIHHVDENKDNNELDNLACIFGKTHVSIHAKENAEKSYDKICASLLEYAVPKAKDWHKSAAGHEWHVRHGKKTLGNLCKKAYCCSWCGNQFETTNRYAIGQNTFCSNKCKSAARRHSGVDNIEKVCEKCGNTYIANKYSRTKYCSCCKTQC